MDYLDKILSRKNLILSLTFLFSLILFLRLPSYVYQIYMIPIVCFIVFLLFKGFSGIKDQIKINYGNDEGHNKIFKRKLLLLVIFAFVYLTARKAFETKWFLENIDNATFLFLGYIPVIFLLRLNPAVTSILSVFFIIFMAAYSLLNYEIMAENFAILAYLFFSTSVIHQIILLSRIKKDVEIIN